ncbi:restriction endonuclease subunit S [Bacteroides eggerthii]|uniref:Type I restriction modification DNA specificity domain protein n=2 Tax=Bacteroidales TaxID=171549 RepID=A0A975KJ64_9BACE|nr:restriction endonuclease subunit S [Bacteroides eggerthii]QUT46414.1 Type I restriction modification DNA specificity domain protein [Bacteroides eggerthii]
MNGKQLKNSILQWAIQGKLVPQDPNDEPASVLLERIRAEKARLVKEKKIKKDKNESIIYRGEDNSYYEKFLATREVKCIDEEIPFEIPATWEWCRLLSIVSLLGDGIHGTPEYSEGGSVYFINGNNLFDGQILIKPDTKTVSKEEAVKHSRLLNESTVLVSINGTIGNIAFYSGENVILGKSACYFNLLNGIERKYIKIVLQTDYFLEYTKRVATGSTIKNVPLSGMRNVLIPIPPKDEQQVIIDKLSSLKLLIEKFNIEQSQLNKLNAELRSVLKKSILQEAIQGKLLPQITEEGTAQELLEQIRQEKQKLVKEGKLKKSALLDSIIYKGDDNKYYERINGQIIEIELSFEYPNSWAVLRLKDICQLIDGEKKNEKGICLDAKYLRGKSSAIIVEKGKFVYTGDNIILVDGENSGEVFTVPQDGYMGSTFKQLWLSSAMWKPYILAFILFYKEDLRNSKRGAAIPHLNKELFYNLPIGIPPYQEQQRIAKRINKLSQLLK